MAGNNRIADLHAALTWDLDDFERGTRQIDKGFGQLIDRARQMASDFASIGKRMTQAFTVPIAGMGAAFTARAVMMANDAKEIKTAARIAGDEIERFQRRAFAAEREAGVAMEKFADISKDTMDKVGDYFATGGGELKEFFEDVAPRVGVTAEMFRGLSGPDALQLFYNTLDRANVSQQEMVFFLESIADEGSALIPLLADNGRLFEELGEKANVFTPEEIEKWIAMKNALAGLGIAFERLFIAIAETGLIEWMTTAIEKGAEFVERFSKANPLLFKLGVIALGVVAALGPVLSLLTTLAVMILPLFLAGMGPVFLALSALINPLGTLLVMGSKFVGIFGQQLLPMLGRLAAGFLGLGGPIGWALAILLLFIDRVIDGLRNVWQVAQEALGPSLTRLFDAVRDAAMRVATTFEEFSRSPLGKFIAAIIDLVGDLVEVLVTIAGSAVVGAFNILINLITALIEWMSGMVEITGSLLRGDWVGAWEAAGDMVQRTINSLFPIFQNLWSWIETALVKLNILEKRAPAAAAAVKGEPRGLGGGAVSTGDNLTDLDDIRAPAPREPWRRTPETPKPAKGRSSGRGRTGPSAEELAERREALALDHQIALARERGDTDELRRLEAKRDLNQKIQQYVRAGLSNAQAKAAAERDAFELESARLDAMRDAIVQRGIYVERQIAQLDNDYRHLRYLEDEEYIERAVRDLQAEGVALAKAEEIAQAELAEIEDARARNVRQRLRDQEAAHEIELARLRGGRDRVDYLREQERIAQRIDELQRQDPDLSDTEALEMAQREAADRSRAYLQGSYRDAMRGGLYAAMNGNFWDWFRDRMRESSFNALAKVLDRLADRLADMMFSQNGDGGGGLFGSLGRLLGGIFGLGGAGNSASTLATGGGVGAGVHEGLHNFASGGSFKVRGFAGIDTNILSLNGTPVARVSQNEIIDVKHGDPGGGGSSHVGVDVRLLGFTDMFDMQVDKRIDRAAPGIAAEGAAQGVKQAIDLNKRTHGAAFSPAS